MQFNGVFLADMHNCIGYIRGVKILKNWIGAQPIIITAIVYCRKALDLPVSQSAAQVWTVCSELKSNTIAKLLLQLCGQRGLIAGQIDLELCIIWPVAVELHEYNYLHTMMVWPSAVSLFK